MRDIGIHLRLMSTATEVLKKAQRLEVDLFQCFFIVQNTGKLIQPDEQDVRMFNELKGQFKDIYAHASYWINLSSVVRTRHWSLDKELALAKKYGFTHMIIHPGSAKGGKNKDEGIDALAHALNKSFKQKNGVQIVLENTAFGKMSVGSDINDFKKLLTKLDDPDDVQFCIDTAHAYSYGYNIATQKGLEQFVDLLEDAIGIERISLIHLNETKEKLGSKADRHQLLGDGIIGDEALKRFIVHPKLAHIPVLLEPPLVSEEQEHAILQKVRSWHT